MERLRVKFSRRDEVKFLSHLDLMRCLERALRRAGFSLTYSEGFTPHPRISLGVPLQVGVTSEAELMDIWLSQWIAPKSFQSEISKQLPSGIELLEALAIPEELPSLQSQVRFADYMVEVESDESVEDIHSAIRSLLDASSLPWHHTRNKDERHYDLRPLIDNIWFISQHSAKVKIGMRLRCDNSGTGRPEQVIKALGFTSVPQSIHRTKLIF
jgi:radical SAM-linked protein